MKPIKTKSLNLKEKLNMKNIKASFKTRSLKVGGYSIFATAIVIAIAFVINLLVSALPSDMMQLDATSNELFSISEQTEQILDGLESDITIYWVVQSGVEDATLETLLQRYQSMSSHIKVIKKDPDVYPTFIQQYTDTVSNNSLIVECDERSRYIDYYDIYVYDYTYYYYDGSYEISFAGESELTSAIDYVINEELPKIYMLTGHGEADLSSTFSAAIEKENILMEELSLLTIEAVPEDADCIFINAPASDISESEKEMLLSYLQGGGNLFLISTPPGNDSLSNLEALMEYYGMTATEGIVVEGNQNYYVYGTPYYLLPEVEAHTITAPLREYGYYVLLPIAQGLSIMDDLRDTLSVSELLTTSDSAFSKIAGYQLTTYEMEDGDIDGPFALALIATETPDDETETNVIWVSSSALVDDQTNMQVSGGNQDFFLNSISFMCDEDESSISIHAKSLDYDYLTIDSSTSALLSILLIGGIPLAYLGIGIYTWIRRKVR